MIPITRENWRNLAVHVGDILRHEKRPIYRVIAVHGRSPMEFDVVDIQLGIVSHRDTLDIYVSPNLAWDILPEHPEAILYPEGI